MENGPPSIGFEDGIVDVEGLIVEPQDEHVSVDSVMCFSEKIPEKAMDISEFPHGYGVTCTGAAHEGGDILNRDVLDSLHTEDDGGYFRLQNDFCSMGEEYLLENCCMGYAGVGFSESITDLEYVSSECLQNSVTDGPVLACAGIESPWKADLFRIMDVPECQNNVVCLKSSEICDTNSPHHESERMTEKKPRESPDRNIGEVHDIPSCSFDGIPSDKNGTSLSQPVEKLSCPKNEKNDEYRQACEIGETKRFQGQDALVTLCSGENQSDVIPTLKRSRKPTKRYIDEVADPILRLPKRRREVSSSTFRDKSVRVKDHKKRHVGSKAVKLPDEESAVKAIQVPFGSLVHKECSESSAYDMQVRSLDRRNMMNKPKDNCIASENQRKRDEWALVVHQLKRSDGIPSASQKKKDHDFSGAHAMKSNQYTPSTHLTKRNDSVTAASHKKKEKDATGAHFIKNDNHLAAINQKTRENTSVSVIPRKECATAICEWKREEDSLAVESPEDVSGRRKHHRLWTLAEVKKLIDGVSDYGVGRWSRIKKVFFSASAHRTSVDLKDKWRNLLKASDLQGQNNQQGEKKRNVAWRPLPKSILRRVCELAAMHPYPKYGKPKIAHIRHVSPDRSTDITLSDYRRILRSINGN